MKNRLKCRALILKVASRCNLNCSYCYMYNAGDTTYHAQPKGMSDEVADAVLTRVYDHCRTHRLRQFLFIFHGGEPLLLPPDFFVRFVARAREKLLPAGVRPHFSLQTNGTLLTAEWGELLARLGVKVGVSLDGPPAVNDARRVDHAGKGTYDAVRRGMAALQRTGRHPLAVLCVIDVNADPLAVYNHFRALGVRTLSFLLPYATHDAPPPGLVPGEGRTPYADWLIPVFDQWFSDPAPKPGIRLFEQVLELLVGLDRGFEYFGGRNLEFLVVETDGGIEAAGALKVCGNGFTKAGMNVLRNEFDEALATGLAQLYHQSHRRLPGPCRRCPIGPVCGGGFLPHRYRRHNGFDNPSVYCADLMKLIVHVQNRLLDALPASLRAEAGLEPLSVREIRRELEIG